ncbi:MAG: hypothetical protein IJ209_07470 [Bacteroidaceae bacterium]|nr:hypothetical protein [Bacteroidaceae bacterium]
MAELLRLYAQTLADVLEVVRHKPGLSCEAVLDAGCHRHLELCAGAQRGHREPQ